VVIAALVAHLLIEFSNNKQKKAESIAQIKAIADHVKPIQESQNDTRDLPQGQNDLYDWLRQKNFIDDDQYAELRRSIQAPETPVKTESMGS